MSGAGRQGRPRISNVALGIGYLIAQVLISES